MAKSAVYGGIGRWKSRSACLNILRFSGMYCQSLVPDGFTGHLEPQANFAFDEQFSSADQRDGIPFSLRAIILEESFFGDTLGTILTCFAFTTKIY